MKKVVLNIIGVLLVFGCGESPQEQQFSSGCSEGGGSYSEGSYTPTDEDSSGEDQIRPLGLGQSN